MSSAQGDFPPVHPMLMPMPLALRHSPATRCPGASYNWRTSLKSMRKPLPKLQSLRDSRPSQSLKPAVDGITSGVKVALWLLSLGTSRPRISNKPFLRHITKQSHVSLHPHSLKSSTHHTACVSQNVLEGPSPPVPAGEVIPVQRAELLLQTEDAECQV